MGNYDRNDRGGNRGGYAPRGRPSFSRGAGSAFGRGGDRGGFQSRDRQMFDAICSNCGKACQVPFRPTGEKPVYCSDCFEKMGGRENSPRPERSDFRPPAPTFDNNKAQFDAINVKLDRLLKLLEPKVAPDFAKASTGKKETKKPTSKKKE